VRLVVWFELEVAAPVLDVLTATDDEEDGEEEEDDVNATIPQTAPPRRSAPAIRRTTSGTAIIFEDLATALKVAEGPG
jgi:hypothetical protein